jgi:hypothetical protein
MILKEKGKGKHKAIFLSMVVHTCNSSTQAMEAGGL